LTGEIESYKSIFIVGFRILNKIEKNSESTERSDRVHKKKQYSL